MSINYIAKERKSHMDIPQVGALALERMEAEKKKMAIGKMSIPRPNIPKSKSQPVLQPLK